MRKLVWFFFKCYTLFLPQTMALRAVELLYQSSSCVILRVCLHQFPVDAEQKCVLCCVRKHRRLCVLQFSLWQGENHLCVPQVSSVAVAWMRRVPQHWLLGEEFGHMH